MTEEYIDSHYHEIIGHESDIEFRLMEADCTRDDLRECNRWYIDTFGSAGENVILIEDDYNKALTELIE